MKKKEYESPTTQIVELKHVGMLMTSAKRRQLDDLEDYELEDDPFAD